MKKILILFGIILHIFLIIVSNCQQSTSDGGSSSPNHSDSSSNSQVSYIATGIFHSAVLFKNGTVKCWGFNDYGQLGYGDTEDRGDEPGEMGSNLPTVDLGTGRTVKKITAGDNHNIVILDNGTVKCWGDNQFGQLGYGDTIQRGDNSGEMGDALPIVDLGAGRTAIQIAAGRCHTVVLLDNQTVKCWGLNIYGQLGYGDTTWRGDNPGEMGNNLLPVDLGTGRTAVQIAAGGDSSFVLLDNGTVKCWGNNGHGQLGYGDKIDRGDNSGEMGNNLLPVDLGTGRTAIQITAGENFAAVLLDNGTVKCWGFNGNGQLGYEDNEDRGDEPGEMGGSLPTVNLGLGLNPVQISAKYRHSMVLFDNGSIKSWGFNEFGSLGYGDTENRGDDPGEMGNNLFTIDLGLGLRARKIFTGGYHSIILLDNGTVKCWGDNSYGELGYGDTEDRGNDPGEMGDNLPVVDL